MEGSKTEPKGSQIAAKMEPKGCQMATNIEPKGYQMATRMAQKPIQNDPRTSNWTSPAKLRFLNRFWMHLGSAQGSTLVPKSVKVPWKSKQNLRELRTRSEFEMNVKDAARERTWQISLTHKDGSRNSAPQKHEDWAPQRFEMSARKELPKSCHKRSEKKLPEKSTNMSDIMQRYQNQS